MSPRTSLALSLIMIAFLVGSLGAQKTESPDVYEFAPLRKPPEYKRKGKLILEPDFFCSFCSKKGKIEAKTRDDMRQTFEVVKKYPTEFEGRKEQTFGAFRMMETDGQDMLAWLEKELPSRDAVFMEDANFRMYCDIPGFNTKKVVMPRRDYELGLLHSVFPRVTDKTVTLSPEHVAHLYRFRAQRLLDDFQALVAYDPKSADYAYSGPWMGMKNKFEVYIFRKKKDFVKFSTYTLGENSEASDGFCWHNLRDRSMVAALHCEGLNDDELNNAFTHRLSYCLLSALRAYQYDVPTWVHMGFSHLMERREYTGYTTHIFGEGKIPKTRLISKWKPSIRKDIAKKEVPPLVEWFAAEGDNGLSWEMHLNAWSLMSYLMQKDQKAMGVFLNLLKKKGDRETTLESARRALKTAFDLTPIQLDEAWRAWVLETYPAI
ncbi:MAG: hypothetical protein R3F20_12525 [Planctomycetota bacterium]